MSAFVIVEVYIEDRERYEDYKKLTPESIHKYGGRFVVRGGKTESLEGDWNPERIVVLRFDSVEQAKKWWSSAEYKKARSIRQSSARTKMIVAEGFDGF